jgi:hypothetical protein
MSIRNHATEAFGTGTTEGLLTGIPRQKFNFTLSITLADGGSPIVFTRIQDLTLPGYSFDTQIVNQYNQKRVIQTKLNYGTLGVTFYDTFDNSFHNILKRYTANYYNSGYGIGYFTDSGQKTDSPIEPSHVTTKGLRTDGDRYFVKEMVITQTGMAGTSQLRSTRLKNCMLTQVNGDTLNYSESAPVVWTTTWQPEHIHVVDIPQTLAT